MQKITLLPTLLFKKYLFCFFLLAFFIISLPTLLIFNNSDRSQALASLSSKAGGAPWQPSCSKDFSPLFIKQWRLGKDSSDFWISPDGISTDESRNVYVSSSLVDKFSSEGERIKKWDPSNLVGDQSALLGGGVATDSLGNVYISTYGYITETGNPNMSLDRIQKFSPEGEILLEWGSEGKGPGELDRPQGIAIDSSGDVYVADANNHRIQKFSPQGAFIKEWGSEGTGPGEFSFPYDVAVDSQGDVYVSDWGNNRIQKFSSNGTFIKEWGSWGREQGQFRQVRGIASSKRGGYIYAVDGYNNRIQKFTLEGNFMLEFGGEGEGPKQFNSPRDVTVDNYGAIYVTDAANGRIQKFSPCPLYAEVKAPIIVGSAKARIRKATTYKITVKNESKKTDADDTLLYVGEGGYNKQRYKIDIPANSSKKVTVKIRFKESGRRAVVAYVNGPWIQGSEITTVKRVQVGR